MIAEAVVEDLVVAVLLEVVQEGSWSPSRWTWGRSKRWSQDHHCMTSSVIMDTLLLRLTLLAGSHIVTQVYSLHVERKTCWSQRIWPQANLFTARSVSQLRAQELRTQMEPQALPKQSTEFGTPSEASLQLVFSVV